RDERSARAITEAGLLYDKDAQGRMAAFLGLADLPPSDATAANLVLALRDDAAAGDVWLPHAPTAAAARDDAAFFRYFAVRARRPSSPEVRQIGARVAEHWARGGKGEEAGNLLASLAQGEPAVNEAIFRGIVRGWPKDKPARLDKAGEAALKRLAVELNPPAR